MPEKANPKCVLFSSGAKAPLRGLSNLADARFSLRWPDDDAFPAFLRNTTREYETAEHAYQALRALDDATAREFEVGGRVSIELFRAFPEPRGQTKFKVVELLPKQAKYWEARRCRGIAAKKVAGLPPAVAKAALGLNLRGRSEDDAPSFEAALAIWGPIHSAKFEQNPELLDVLRSTAPGVLVEAGRFRSACNFWTGFVGHDGVVVGTNMMGRLLQAFRDRRI